MRKSTYDLCKQYGDYNMIVKALAGSYDELAEAMKNAEIKKNEDIINAATDTQRQVSNVAEK
jgi:predicted kinase